MKIFTPRCLAYKRTNFFQPFDIIPHDQCVDWDPLKESVSSRLLNSYGVVRQAGPGSFYLLPLGLRSLNKLENLIDNELQKKGCMKIALPLITQGSLWKKSGRLESIGQELAVFKDRKDRTQVVSPTHEESITNMMKTVSFPSESTLPIRLYQCGTKFRDEMRPKFGLLRAKEFIMKDLYTFDKDHNEGIKTYDDITEAYRIILNKLKIPYVRVDGDTGQMGGSQSHEYQILAPIGQDTLQVCKTCLSGANLELGDKKNCINCGRQMEESKGIEVGHTFLLGEKYSSTFQATYKTAQGKSKLFYMGCYGIGVSRLLAASVEVLSTKNELRWPELIAPFTVCIITPKSGSKEEVSAGSMLDQFVEAVDKTFKSDFIIDDREKISVGKKLKEAKMTGYPYIVLFGKKCKDEDPILEIHIQKNDTVLELQPNAVIEYLSNVRQDMEKLLE